MSVSLLEVIEAGGYDLATHEDANWLLSKQSEFEELIEEAEATLEGFNTCDKCQAVEKVDDLLWLTSDGFTLSPGEKLPSEANGYDAVCVSCFDELIEEGDNE